MKRILLYLLLAVLAHLTMIGQQTQQTLTIYPDATETNIYVPMHPSDFDSYTRSQYVVPADALETMYGATITSLKYYTTDDGIPYTAPCTLDVYLKEVSYTSISSFEPKANCTIVYTGTLNFGYYGSGGEVTITFSTPYVYNGGNLLVGIENTTTTYGYETAWIHFYGQTVTGASVGNFHNNLNGISPTQRNFIPKTTFTYTPDNCPKPNNLEASDITTSSATLSWTPKGEETSWDVQYRMVGETNWIDKGTVNTTPTCALDNLSEYTEYQFRVKPNCTEGANWTDPVTFRTLSLVTTVDEDHPYSTGFEGETLDWHFIQDGQTNAWAWGSATQNGGSKSLYVSNNGGTNNQYSVYDSGKSKSFAVKSFHLGVGYYYASFDWKNKGEGSCDFLRVALAPVTTTLTPGVYPCNNFDNTLPTDWMALDGGYRLSNFNTWQSQSVEFELNTEGDYLVIFAWSNDYGGGEQPPAAVDNFSFSYATCPRPTTPILVWADVNYAIFDWTALGSETTWNMQYKRADETTWTDVSETINEHPYTLNGLTSGTDYQVRVQAGCGSNWTNPFSFTTLCDPNESYPILENFNSLNATYTVPDCWNKADGTATLKWSFYGLAGHTGQCMSFYSIGNSNGSTSYLKTPIMNLPAGETMQLGFWYKNTGIGDFSIYISTDNGRTYTTPLVTAIPAADDWTEMEIPVPTTYNGMENVVFVFKATSNESSAHLDLDDVYVEVMPTCFKPKDVHVTALSQHSATLAWTNGSEENTWEIAYSTDPDFDPFTQGTRLTVTENPYTLTGLNSCQWHYAYIRAKCTDTDVSKWSGTVCSFFSGDVLTVNDGTATDEYIPLGRNFLKSVGDKSQFIIPASSLTEVSNSRISKLTFYSTTKDYDFGEAQFRVYLAETSQTTFGSNAFLSTGDMTLVYSGSLEGKGYKMEVTFDTPFDYFGGNLMVAFYGFSASNYNQQNVDWLGVNTSSYTCIYHYYSNSYTSRGYFLPKTTISYASFTKPVNVTVSDFNAAGATLSWVPMGDETHWDVFYTDNPDYVPTANTRPQFANIGTNPYTMTGLPMGHNYYIYVRSINGNEVSDWSDPCVFLYANQITLNDGTVTNQLVPVAGYYVSYNNTYGKFILPASDLQDLIHAEIRQVTFYTDSPADISWGGLTYSLSLMETDLTEMTTSTNFSGGQQCFYGNVSVTGNKMTLTFSEPYLYEGGNLLLYYTTYRSGTVNNVKPYWLGVTTENTSGYGSSYYSYRYSTSYSSTTSGVQSFLPKTTISYVFPDCVKPAGLEVGDITTNAATLSWTAIGSGQTGWEIQYKKIDETDYTTVEGTITTPYTLQGLESSHGYMVRVRAICGKDSYSDWLETSFYTDCSSITLPYAYGFEDVENYGYPPCWSRYSTNNGYPSVREYQTHDGYTHTGTHSLYFYGSGAEYTVMAVLPQIPVSAQHPINGNELVFYAAGYYQTTSCQVGVMTDPSNPATFETVKNVEVTNYCYGGDGFRKYRVSFAGYPGNGTYIAIRLTEATGTNLYIDDIEVRPIPNCLEPANLNVTAVTSSTATLQWTAGGEETSWQIQYKLENDEWPDTFQTTDQNPFTLEDLIPTSSYQVRVRAVCSATETSDWTGFASFETYGNVPYFEDFGDSSYSPLTGWEWANGNLDQVLAGTAQLDMTYSDWQTSTQNFTGNGMTYYTGTLAECYVSSSSSYYWLLTPNIELGEDYQLSFDLALDYNHSATSGLDDNRFAVLVSQDGGATWGILALWDNDGTQGRAYYDIPALISEVNIDLPDTYNNKTVRFAFYAESVTYNSGTNHLYLDNVNVTKCIKPELIVASDITTNSAVLDWTDHGETSWMLQYRIDGFGDWTTINNLTAHSYTLEGLANPYNYQVRVKAHSTEGDSEWSNIAIFATECAPINLGPNETYTQYFDGREVPACWSSHTYAGSGGWYFGNTVYDEQGNVLYCVGGSSYGSNAFNADLNTPQITVTPGLCLTFHHSISISSNAIVSAFVNLPSSETVTLWDTKNDNLSTGVTSISLNDYVGQTISFTFNYSSTGSSAFNIFDVTLYNLNTFTKQTEDGYWNETGNWSAGTLPEATETVVVAGEAVIPDGCTAQAEEVLITSMGSLTIADGGQLIHNNQGVQAMVQKAITPYTVAQGNGDQKPNSWYLIASPIQNAVEPSESLISNNFDLYRFNQSETLEWENYQQFFYLSPYFKLFNGQGYLYANDGGGSNDDVTIGLEGKLRPGNEVLELPLSYDASAQFAGWNLIGNPFAHNVTAYTAYNVEDGCFRMNDTHDDLMVSEISTTDPLKPMEGFFVKATDMGATLTFNTSKRDEFSGDGSIFVEVLDDGKIIDRLIVKMQDRMPLEKFSLSEHRTKVFVPRDHREMAIVSCEGNEQPVYFKAEKNGTYTIRVSETLNSQFSTLNHLHLIDNLTGADIDVLQTPTYTFTARTTDYASRFTLVFNANDHESENDNFAFISNGQLIVTGEGILQIFDVLGHQLYAKQVSLTTNLSTLTSPGVYVLRLIQGDTVRCQKIVID